MFIEVSQKISIFCRTSCSNVCPDNVGRSFFQKKWFKLAANIANVPLLQSLQPVHLRVRSCSGAMKHQRSAQAHHDLSEVENSVAESVPIAWKYQILGKVDGVFPSFGLVTKGKTVDYYGKQCNYI